MPDYEETLNYNITSYTDQKWPLGQTITWPRSYRYDLSGNYS